MGYLTKVPWCLAKFPTLHKTKSGQSLFAEEAIEEGNYKNRLNNYRNLPIKTQPADFFATLRATKLTARNLQYHHQTKLYIDGHLTFHISILDS